MHSSKRRKSNAMQPGYQSNKSRFRLRVIPLVGDRNQPAQSTTEDSRVVLGATDGEVSGVCNILLHLPNEIKNLVYDQLSVNDLLCVSSGSKFLRGDVWSVRQRIELDILSFTRLAPKLVNLRKANINVDGGLSAPHELLTSGLRQLAEDPSILAYLRSVNLIYRKRHTITGMVALEMGNLLRSRRSLRSLRIGVDMLNTLSPLPPDLTKVLLSSKLPLNGLDVSSLSSLRCIQKLRYSAHARPKERYVFPLSVGTGIDVFALQTLRFLDFTLALEPAGSTFLDFVAGVIAALPNLSRVVIPLDRIDRSIESRRDMLSGYLNFIQRSSSTNVKEVLLNALIPLGEDFTLLFLITRFCNVQLLDQYFAMTDSAVARRQLFLRQKISKRSYNNAPLSACADSIAFINHAITYMTSEDIIQVCRHPLCDAGEVLRSFCLFGHVDALAKLLALGVPDNFLRPSLIESALQGCMMYSRIENCTAVLQLLTNRGAERASTPDMIAAACFLQSQTLWSLLNARIIIPTACDSFETIVSICKKVPVLMSHKICEALPHLVEFGLRLDAVCSRTGTPALLHVIEERFYELATEMICQGVSAHVVNSVGMNAIAVAIRSYNPKSGDNERTNLWRLLASLIGYNVPLYTRDDNGDTAIDWLLSFRPTARDQLLRCIAQAYEYCTIQAMDQIAFIAIYDDDDSMLQGIIDGDLIFATSQNQSASLRTHRFEDKETTLNSCIKRSSWECMKIVLRDDVAGNPNRRGAGGVTACQLLSSMTSLDETRFVSLVHKLYRKQGDFNIKDSRGFNCVMIYLMALSTAIDSGEVLDAGIVRVQLLSLLACGAQLSGHTKTTPMHLAVLINHEEISVKAIQALALFGAPLNELNDLNQTPFLLATELGREAQARCLMVLNAFEHVN